jgi:hypothetical protein
MPAKLTVGGPPYCITCFQIQQSGHVTRPANRHLGKTISYIACQWCLLPNGAGEFWPQFMGRVIRPFWCPWKGHAFLIALLSKLESTSLHRFVRNVVKFTLSLLPKFGFPKLEQPMAPRLSKSCKRCDHQHDRRTDRQTLVSHKADLTVGPTTKIMREGSPKQNSWLRQCYKKLIRYLGLVTETFSTIIGTNR